MSLSAAMDSAVSALQAQSKALSLISSNLANSSTVGYKTVDASFASLLSQPLSMGSYSSGGVTVSSVQNVSLQGLLQSSSSATSMAIYGDGFFPVTYGLNGSTVYYTRDGEFSVDSDGYLVNGNYNLVGWPTDNEGNVSSTNVNSVGALEAINLNRYSSMAAATSEITLKANIPADAEDGATFTTSLDAYDALGNAQSIPLTWTKSSTADNTWTLTIGDPTDPTTGDQSGTVGGTTTYTVSFNADGTLAGIADDLGNSVDTATIAVSNWNDGADTATYGDITLNLGTVGGTDGLSQFASGDTDPSIEVKSISKDGVAYGSLSGVEISSDGTVNAKYDNGEELSIYKIPVVTFADEGGLTLNSYGVYEETSESGSPALHIAGTDGAGSIENYYLEGSTTDTTEEFSKMIIAQQAYSAASQVISTSKTMFDALIQAVR